MSVEHVRTMLDLSTGHVPLHEAPQDSPVAARIVLFGEQRVAEHEHGFTWYLPAELNPLDPGWLRPVFAEAARFHAAIVNFDADGPQVEGLPWYA